MPRVSLIHAFSNKVEPILNNYALTVSDLAINVESTN